MQGQTKLEKVQKSRASKTAINPDAKLKEIKADPEGTQYRCTSCGKCYKRQRNNFYSSSSPLFTGNNGYVSVCKSCAEKYFTYLIEVFSGNEEKALDRICSIFDWYYNDEIAASSRKVKADYSRLASYISKLNLLQNRDKGTTYLDTIRDRTSETIGSIEDLEEFNETGEKGISSRSVKQWGFGYEPEEYAMLTEHYKLLTGQFTNADAVQDALIKDLCRIKVLQNRAMKNGNDDSFEKFTKLYHSTLKAGDLKTRSFENDNLDDENACWGNFIRDIEEHTPAEIYKDQKLFSDADNIKEYFKRFVVRPFKNFFTGENVMDKEFSISLGGDNDV